MLYVSNVHSLINDKISIDKGLNYQREGNFFFKKFTLSVLKSFHQLLSAPSMNEISNVIAIMLANK